jgi:outer membrane protein assembly factor BamD
MPDTPQRDTRPTSKAVDTFTRLLVDYPQSEHAAEAQKLINEARAQLAEKIYEIGRFYEKQDQYDSAAKRYQSLVLEFPESRLAEEAFARHVRSLRRAGKGDEAAIEGKRFQEKFPDSEFKSMIVP